METVLVTGGTGMIGRALCRTLLQRNYAVIVITRDVVKRSLADLRLTYAKWDLEKKWIDEEAFAKADHIIHLAGAGVADKRWTKKRKKAIAKSRIDSSRLIADYLRQKKNKVKTIVSSSATGWYGPDPSIPNPHPFIEAAPSGNDFLATTCRQWEESIAPAKSENRRLVLLRTGPVLSQDGGMLGKYKIPLRWRIAPVLGSGKQMISWISIDDLVNMYIAAIQNENMEGVYNAVATTPVSNRDLGIQLARNRGGFFIRLRVPSFLLKIIYGELSVEVLKSCTVDNGKITATGFRFLHPDLKSFLK